jgi:hypothetical protein
MTARSELRRIESVTESDLVKLFSHTEYILGHFLWFATNEHSQPFLRTAAATTGSWAGE